MILQIYSNNEGTTIYILHIMVMNILYTVSSIVLGRNILQTVLTRVRSNLHLLFYISPFQMNRVIVFSFRIYDML
jgi:hypothetical protein